MCYYTGMKFLIEVTEEQEKQLRQIAARWGYVLDRSQKKGQGNVAGLLRAIADGDIAVVNAIPELKSNND